MYLLNCFKSYLNLKLLKYLYINNENSSFHFRRILAAACEKKSVMLFDPVTQKYITSIKKAHNDCVNCIK